MRKLLFAVALAAGAASTSMAWAGPITGPDGPIKGPNLPVANADCATGFTASPSSINANSIYNQSYKCTGPKIVCSTHFSPLGSPVAVSGGIGGATDTGPPVTIKSGRMVYTCAEPPSPPK